MADLTDELAGLNENARLLLEKYDGVFAKLDEQSKQALIDISNKSDEGLEAIQTLLDEGIIATAENANKLQNMTLEELVAYVFENEPEPESTVAKFDFFEDGSAVALYQFDGNSNDTGGVHDATDNNGSYDTSKYGQGALFTGGDDKPILTDIELTGDFTVSMWVKLSDLTDNQRILDFSLNATTNEQQCGVYYYNGGLNYSFNQQDDIQSLKDVQEDYWYNIIIDSNADMFINGSAAPDTNTDSRGDATAKMAFNNYNSQDFYGIIDQVRVFDRLLSSTEKQSLYEEQ